MPSMYLHYSFYVPSQISRNLSLIYHSLIKLINFRKVNQLFILLRFKYNEAVKGFSHTKKNINDRRYKFIIKTSQKDALANAQQYM